jgi:hypothetical protein
MAAMAREDIDRIREPRPAEMWQKHRGLALNPIAINAAE